VDSALTLVSPTGSRRRDVAAAPSAADIEMATVDLGASAADAEDDKRWAGGAGGKGRNGAGLNGGAGLRAGSLSASRRPRRRDRADLLAESFRWMFPRSFERLVPVPNCQARRDNPSTGCRG